MLDHLAAHADVAFGLSELCRDLAMSKATAHALLGELTDAGYLVRDPLDKTYRLGPRLLAVGLAARHPEQEALDRARPHLRRLATQHGARCVATAVRGTDMVALEVAGRDRPLGPSLQPGHRIPFDPPLGTAFLVGAPPAEVERWMSRAGRPLGPEERQAYLDAIDSVRTLGCSLSLDAATRPLLVQAVVADSRTRPPSDLVHELSRQGYLLTHLEEGARYRLSVAVAPVIGPKGRVVLGLTIYDLVGARTTAEVRQVAHGLRRAADAVSEAIGGVALEPPERP